MPLKLDVRKKLSSRSDRVKSIDLHSTEPWVCASLYNGNVHVWNVESQQLIKTFEVASVPVRAVRFVPRKNWIVTGSDDMFLRVFNYNTLERVHQFEAHSDYIRSIAVHPTQPFILTCSDDMYIRLYDWEKNWVCAQTFEGHAHYVMQLVINPKDNNTFASASLDNTVKVWSLGSHQPNFTLEGHLKGVNCVDYHPSPDKPYLASGSDDRTVRIWDYQTKLCVQVLEGHAQNVSSLAFHPDLPVILTGSEDGTIRMWHSNTYRLESTLNYGLERVWAVACHKGSQQVGIGYDEGTIVISLGHEDPAMSMDSTGKLVYARHSELVQSNIRAVISGGEKSGDTIEDGARLPLTCKDLGACEIYPQTLAHNADGRFVVVCGDGEYIIYTAMALRNRMFGQALDFVWSQADPTMYAILENNTTVRIYKNFKEAHTFKLDFGADQIFGGFLLGIRSIAGFTFYDWGTGKLLRRIDVSPKYIYWADGGQLVSICTKDCFYILRYHPELIAAAEADRSIDSDPDGVEAAFEVIADGEVKEVVKTGCWFGNAFLFTNTSNRLVYYVGGELVTVAHLDRPMYLLGYLASANRVFLADKDLHVVGYMLLLSVLEYETAVLQGDFTTADSILPSIPNSHRTKVAHFLERQGFRAQALRVTTDPDHKFDLAVQLNDLTTAHDLIKSDPDVESNETKWKQLTDIAVKECDFELAQECFGKTRDYGSFLMVATCSGNEKMVQKLAEDTSNEEIDNLAFLSKFILSDFEGCLQLLVKAQRFPEAAFFARSYLPSHISPMVEAWRGWLKDKKKSPKVADALADPTEYVNLFPELNQSLQMEAYLKSNTAKLRTLPASSYPSQSPMWKRSLTAELLAHDGVLSNVLAEPQMPAPAPLDELLDFASAPVPQPETFSAVEVVNLLRDDDENLLLEPATPTFPADNDGVNPFGELRESRFDAPINSGFGGPVDLGLGGQATNTSKSFAPEVLLPAMTTTDNVVEEPEEDFDDVLEQQLASFSFEKPVAKSHTEALPKHTADPTMSNDWGDDDDESYGDA